MTNAWWNLITKSWLFVSISCIVHHAPFQAAVPVFTHRCNTMTITNFVFRNFIFNRDWQVCVCVCVCESPKKILGRPLPTKSKLISISSVFSAVKCTVCSLHIVSTGNTWYWSLKLRSDCETFNRELRLDGFINEYLLKKKSWFRLQ